MQWASEDIHGKVGLCLHATTEIALNAACVHPHAHVFSSFEKAIEITVSSWYFKGSASVLCNQIITGILFHLFF